MTVATHVCPLCRAIVGVAGAEFRASVWFESQGTHKIERCKVFALVGAGYSRQREPIVLVIEAHECSTKKIVATPLSPPMHVATWPLATMATAARAWAADLLERAIQEVPEHERAVSWLIYALRAGNGSDAQEHGRRSDEPIE